jgi:hypothetical protein
VCSSDLIDYRHVKEPEQILAALMRQSSIMLWAEGPEKKAVAGKDRHELQPADALAIWTIPPSLEELRAVMQKVHPRTVYLFARTEPDTSLKAYLERLVGLLKYAIRHRAGNVSYSELETATAQRGVTVRKGVEWLVLQGEIALKTQKEGELVVTDDASQKNAAGAAHLLMEIRALLEETVAYRAHFKQAEKESLIPQ